MGKVYLVGAGPGDPGLITVRGEELMKRADMIVYDRLIPHELLNLPGPECKKVYVGKQMGRHSFSQEEINRILVQGAEKYGIIVRLKGGDPFVFGRGGEEVLALQREGIPFEIVPGVTSAIAVPSHQGIPVTHRRKSRSFHVVTGHQADGEQDFSIYAGMDGTLVFLMGLSSLSKIVSDLIRGGMNPETPSAVISNAYSYHEQCVRAPLNTIALSVAGLDSPAVIVIGSCAAYDFRDSQNNRNCLPRISVVGTSAFFRRLKESMDFRYDGLLYLVEIELMIIPDGFDELEKRLLKIEEYSWIILNSQNAVKIFFDAADKIKLDRRRFSGVRFGVIGPGTSAALQKYGFYADYMPDVYTSEALAEGLVTRAGNGRLLVIRAQEGNPVMEQRFRESGILYDKIELYRSVGKWNESIHLLQDSKIIVFASASGVRCFQNLLDDSSYSLPQDTMIVCIGNATANAVRQWGREPSLVAEEHSTAGLWNTLRRRLIRWKE